MWENRYRKITNWVLIYSLNKEFPYGLGKLIVYLFDCAAKDFSFIFNVYAMSELRSNKIRQMLTNH